jgi:putative acetyltransferase
VSLEIRAASKNDAAELHRLRSQEENAEMLITTPYVSIDEVEKHLDSETNTTILVAEWTDNEGKGIVGTVCLVMGEGREAHTGNIQGMMVDQSFHSRGVGTQLMEAILDLADNWLALIRLQLDVMEDNEPAIGLYEKYGFVKEGLRRYASVKDGKYTNEYLMARYRLPEIPQGRRVDAPKT